MNTLTQKYWLRLAIAQIKDLKKSYMRAKVLPADPEITKALVWFDTEIKKVFNQLLGKRVKVRENEI